MSEIYYVGPLPVPFDIKLYQGADFAHSMEYKDGNDSPVDLTGYKAQMQIREEDTHALLLDLNTVDGGITIVEATGIIGITITSAQSSAFEVQKAKYDLLLKSSDGTITYLLYGDFIVTPRVTRESIP